MPPRIFLMLLWQRLKHRAAVITAGGSWSVQLPDTVQRNLRWYFMDGVLASSQEAINLTYLTLFILALGATKAQIGLMTSLASLSAVMLLLPGALLAERFGKRKWIVVASGGGIARLALLSLALLPFFVRGPQAVTIFILLKVIMDGFTYLGMPAWTSLSADIVPLSWRGRFYGSRNMVMSMANMLVTLAAGQSSPWQPRPSRVIKPFLDWLLFLGLARLFVSPTCGKSQSLPIGQHLRRTRPLLC